MKQPLPQLLEYPYEVMQAHVKLIGCGQHGIYNKRSHECRLCPDRLSCIWVNELNNDMSRNYSEHKKTLLLEHALDSMMSYVQLLEHDVHHCSCRNCKWIRNALNTYNDLLIKQDKSSPYKNSH